MLCVFYSYGGTFRPCVYSGPAASFQMELLAVREWFRLRNLSHVELFTERALANGWNGSKPGQLGTGTAIHCLST